MRKDRIPRPGDVFLGLEKIKNEGQRKLLESERHMKYMSMLGNRPNISAGLPSKVAPETWLKAFIDRVGPERAETLILEIIKNLSSTDIHPITRSVLDAPRTKADLKFYEQALYLLLKQKRA